MGDTLERPGGPSPQQPQGPAQAPQQGGAMLPGLEGLADALAMLAAAQSATAQALERVTVATMRAAEAMQQAALAAAAPRRIVRDPATGKAIGAEVVPADDLALDQF